MHVAVDAHNLLTDRRGIGVAVRAVIKQWIECNACDLTLLVRRPLPMLAKTSLARELNSRAFALASRVPRRAHALWHPWNGTFFEANGVPAVATIHDVAPFAFPAHNAALRESQQAPFRRTAQSAQRILADSHFTQTEIERYLKVPRDRITCVPLAADERYSPGSAETLPPNLRERPYILYVGAIEARKNVGTLIDAWRTAFPSNDVALTLVTTHAVPPDTIALRDLSVERLRDLYRGALAVAVPSTYEGFGLPALEALACGAPVVASRASSLPEVCADAALYVDPPLDAAQWVAALQRIAVDPVLRAHLQRAGPQQAARFSWSKTAQETLNALGSVRHG